MITYLIYRLCEYFKTKDTDLEWQKGRAIIATSGLIVINLFTVFLLVNSLFFKDVNLFNYLLSSSGVLNKFILIPIIISPVFIIIYYLAKTRLNLNIERFKSEPKEKRRKNGVFIIVYIILSIISLQLVGILRWTDLH
jgi:hypothetical protein